MCIIIKREDPGSHPYRAKHSILHRQDGFTLPEMLVSLCIMGIVMHGVWQWGTVLYRTSDTMAQNYQAVYLAQQIYAGLSPECPAEWNINVESVSNGGLLYETSIEVKHQQRRWHFYYVGPEEIGYEANANSA